MLEEYDEGFDELSDFDKEELAEPHYVRWDHSTLDEQWSFAQYFKAPKGSEPPIPRGEVEWIHHMAVRPEYTVKNIRMAQADDVCLAAYIKAIRLRDEAYPVVSPDSRPATEAPVPGGEPVEPVAEPAKTKVTT